MAAPKLLGAFSIGWRLAFCLHNKGRVRKVKVMRTYLTAAALALAVYPAIAQTQGSGGWRKFGDGDGAVASAPATATPDESQSAQRPQEFERREQAPPPQYQQPQHIAIPSRVTIPAGTWLTVRVDQPVSSDHNHAGDAFTATLTSPVVANGIVVARRGQTLAGRVTETAKAGFVKGTSRLGVELIDLSIVDGQRVPIKTTLMKYEGGRSIGRDATAIGATTGIGAAIGGAAAGGFGAGLGAIAGAGASVIGVLSTRGRSTEIYPETAITFQLSEPVDISTERGMQAFQPIRQQDYETRQLQSRPQVHVVAPPSYFGNGYGYGGYGYPYYSPYRAYGPSFYFRSGGGYYGGHHRR